MALDQHETAVLPPTRGYMVQQNIGAVLTQRNGAARLKEQQDTLVFPMVASISGPDRLRVLIRAAGCRLGLRQHPGLDHHQGCGEICCCALPERADELTGKDKARVIFALRFASKPTPLVM